MEQSSLFGDGVDIDTETPTTAEATAPNRQPLDRGGSRDPTMLLSTLNDPFSSVPNGSIRKEGLSRVDGTAPLASICVKRLARTPGRNLDPGPAGLAAPPGTGAADRR